MLAFRVDPGIILIVSMGAIRSGIRNYVRRICCDIDRGGEVRLLPAGSRFTRKVHARQLRPVLSTKRPRGFRCYDCLYKTGRP